MAAAPAAAAPAEAADLEVAIEAFRTAIGGLPALAPPCTVFAPNSQALRRHAATCLPPGAVSPRSLRSQAAADAVLAHVVPGAALRLEDLRHLHSSREGTRPTLMARSGAVLGVECGCDGGVAVSCSTGATSYTARIVAGDLWPTPGCVLHVLDEVLVPLLELPMISAAAGVDAADAALQ